MLYYIIRLKVLGELGIIQQAKDPFKRMPIQEFISYTILSVC